MTTSIDTRPQPLNEPAACYKLLPRADLPRRNIYATRHTGPFLWIADGVPLGMVLELLGHSQNSTKANFYGHVFSEALREAANATDFAI